MKRFAAVVADIALESRAGPIAKWRMSLTPAGFAVGESGVLEAVTRKGAALVIPVLAVESVEGVVWCLVEKPLAAGTDVIGIASDLV